MANIVNYNSSSKIFDRADETVEFLAEKIRIASEKPYHIALSGGSTPILLFKLLSNNYRDNINWNNIFFYWGDERCVAADSSDSNYGVCKSILLDNINIPTQNIFPIIGNNNPMQEKIRYADIITNNVSPSGKIPSFDLIILGMGDDGHTASIFPNNMQMFNEDVLIKEALHPVSNQMRLSFTPLLINHAKEILFLVTGKNKAVKVNEIFNHSEKAKNYPAYHINPVNGTMLWILDKDAASLLVE